MRGLLFPAVRSKTGNHFNYAGMVGLPGAAPVNKFIVAPVVAYTLWELLNYRFSFWELILWFFAGCPDDFYFINNKIYLPQKKDF